MNDDNLITLKPYVDFRQQMPHNPTPPFIAALIAIGLIVGCFFIIRAAYSASLVEPVSSVCRNEFGHRTECVK